MSDTTPVILEENIPFSCFGNLLQGSIKVTVCQAHNSCVFPVQITADTNVGKGVIPIEIKGNEIINKKVFGVDIIITISNWFCDQKTVSCHVKAVGEKIFYCTVIDKDFNVNCHDEEAHKMTINNLITEIESLS